MVSKMLWCNRKAVGMQAEMIAALYEAAEEVGDDALVLALVMALRDPVLRREARALLREPPPTPVAAWPTPCPPMPKAANA